MSTVRSGMLPRLTTQGSYDQNGEFQVRYTGVWATRPLGSMQHIAYTSDTSSHVEQAQWEEKPESNTSFFLLIAFLQLSCALAFTSLGVYHCISQTDYRTPDAAGLVITGVPSILVALLAVAAFRPGKSCPISKRLVIIFSVLAVYTLLRSIRSISLKMAIGAPEEVDSFHIAELAMALVLLVLLAMIMYPASRAFIASHDQPQPTGCIRAAMLASNTIVAVISIIYLGLSIYGLHDDLDSSGNVAAAQQLRITLFAIPITGLMLVASVGSFNAAINGIRSHVIPYAVCGLVALIFFLLETETYVDTLDLAMTHDFREAVFIGMFALNCLSIVGVAIVISLSIAFAFL